MGGIDFAAAFIGEKRQVVAVADMIDVIARLGIEDEPASCRASPPT